MNLVIERPENRPRKLFLWTTLAVIAVLAVLSVVGSFLGAARARHLFNGPLAGLWIALTAFLMAAVVYSPNILRRAPSLAMHLGAIAILLGSMWNSPPGHLLARKWFSIDKVAGGFMTIYQHQASREILDGSTGGVIARLPFDVVLNRFSIEYYPPKRDEWHLVAIVPRAATDSGPHEGPSPCAASVVLDWEVGRELAIPGAGVKLKVLEYIPHAEPVLREPASEPGAEPTSQSALGDLDVSVEAQAKESSSVPAMRIALTRQDGAIAQAWMIVDSYIDMAVLRLSGVPDGSERGGGQDATLLLCRPDSPIKSYKSDVAVEKDGRTVAGKVIEVNHPMHYGGYHFYQSSYDPEGRQYTVLSVTSDSGLWMVYAGMAMLTAGAFWFCWIGPIIRRVRDSGRASGGRAAGDHGD